MIATATPLVEITRTAIHLLCREIGVVNTARFLNQFTLGYGNYTEEREQLFGDQTVESLVAEIKRQKARPIKEARGSLPGLNTDVLREEEDRL